MLAPVFAAAPRRRVQLRIPAFASRRPAHTEGMNNDVDKGISRASNGQKAIGAGLTLAVSVGAFAYGGIWLDRQFGTKPWLLLLLVACGIVGGMLHLVRVVAPEMWPFGKLPVDDRGERGDEDAD